MSAAASASSLHIEAAFLRKPLYESLHTLVGTFVLIAERVSGFIYRRSIRSDSEPSSMCNSNYPPHCAMPNDEQGSSFEAGRNL